MFKDDSKLLRMSIYRPKKQGYRYKQLYAKYGRYAQLKSSESVSADFWSPARSSSGRPQHAGFSFLPAFFEFNPCALKTKNNGNMSLKSTKYYSNISNPNITNNCTFRHVENILENSFSNKNCLNKI